MASSLHFLALFSFLFLVSPTISQRPRSGIALVIPVTKDASTLQYIAQVNKGSPIDPVSVVVDLGGSFLWVDCASGHASSSHRLVQCGSLQCSTAKANGKICFSDRPNTCSLNTVNTIKRLATRGELAEDVLAVGSVDLSDETGLNPFITAVDGFLFSCAPSTLLTGLPSGAKGMLGLGRNRIALPSQVATKFGFQRKFAVCLSSSDGVIISGDRPSASFPSLMYTPLISDQDGTSGDYYINVKSIKVNDKKLSLNATVLSMGGTKLSTILPYTTMESSIYETFVNAYVEAATSMNMTRVGAVSPFGVCFGSAQTSEPPVEPTIELVLQSEMVKWRIDGRNSLVKLSDEVTCLGFLDGGVGPRASIVIGGYQLEDNLLEFDLGTSMLGFSSSLQGRGTSCSEFKLYSSG